MSDWFKTGNEAHEKMEQDEERRSSEQNNIFRLWMPKNSELHATFLDDVKHPAGYESPFVYNEHNLHLNGHWRNWFTCIEGIPHPDTGKPQKCPICAAGDKSYLASAFTIVDHSKWTSKKNAGVVHEHELKLFVCKAQVQKILRKNAKKREGLRGWYTEISRTDGQSPNTGDQFDFEKRMDDAAFSKLTNKKFPALPQPLDYHELFAPKTQEELQKIISGGDSGGYEGGTSYDDTAADDSYVKF